MVVQESRMQQGDGKPDCQAHSGIKVGSELDFAQIMNAIGQGVLVTGEGWRFEYVNPAFARIVGKPIADLIGKSMDDFIITEDLPLLAKQRSERLAGNTTTYEFRLRRSDGEIVYVNATGVPRRFGDKVVGSISVIVGIAEQKKTEEALKAERIRAENSERKQIEQALRESEERYATTLASIGDAVIATDIEGRVLFMNAVAEGLTGWALSEASMKPAKSVFKIINEYTRQEVEDPVTKIIETGEIFGLANHTLLIRRDGTAVAIDDSGAPIKDRNGNITGIVLVFRDITERKQAEEALRENEALQRTLLASLPAGVIIIDPVTREIEMANGAASALFGASEEYIVGRRCHKFLCPAAEDACPICDLGKEVDNAEKEMICADGSRHPILKSVKRVQIRGREKLLECFLDLTERRRMEDELRIKDKAIESSINAIAITDLQWNLTYVNSAFLTMWGYSDEKEILGRAIDEFGEAKERSTEIKAAVQNCGGWIGELRAEKKDGLIFDAQMSTSMVVDDAGRPLCMLGIFVDITERKQAELNLARSNQELQQFAYIASHDLQEPLRMISSYLQLIELQYKGKLDAEADEFIGYAVDGAKRLRDMINALLAYSRIETRNRPIEPVESEPLLSQALINLQVGIDESGAQVTHDPLPIITADGTQMVQVFQNLISNAIKFHGHDQPKVHISATQQRAEWVFSVRDNGIGIEPQYMEQIFTIFKRLHGREYPGTGIGLALCKRIVERHKGRIWVESDPGKGTTFYFTIPD